MNVVNTVTDFDDGIGGWMICGFVIGLKTDFA